MPFLPPKTLHALEDLYCTGPTVHFEGRDDALVHLYMALRPRDPNAYDNALDLVASFNEPEPVDQTVREDGKGGARCFD